MPAPAFAGPQASQEPNRAMQRLPQAARVQRSAENCPTGAKDSHFAGLAIVFWSLARSDSVY
jgi:hypothetical protein